MSLHDDLTDIQGVGDATADKVLDVLADHDTGGVDENVREAYDYLEAGRPEYAKKFLRRVVE